MCKYSHIVDFLGSRRMETAPTSIEVLLRPTLGQSDEPSDLRGSLSPTSVYSTWQSLWRTFLIPPGGHPSNYEPGATLLNFRDRANTDELTPSSVYRPCHKSIKFRPNYVRAFPDHTKEVIGPYNLLDHINGPFHALLHTDHVDR